MAENTTTSVNFEHAVHLIEFQENRKKLSSYFFHVEQKIDQNIGDILKFHAIWETARSTDQLPSWNTPLSEQLSEWHQVMRVSYIGSMIEPERSNIVTGKIFPHIIDTENSGSQGGKIDDLSLKNRNKYREYLRYIYTHHYVISIGTAAAYDGGTPPIMLMSLPLSENGTDVTHILSAVTPMN